MSGNDDINLDPADIDVVDTHLSDFSSRCDEINAAFAGIGAAAFGPTAAGALARYHRDGAQLVETAQLNQILASNTDIRDVLQHTIADFGALDELDQYRQQQLIAQIFANLGLSGLFGNKSSGDGDL